MINATIVNVISFFYPIGNTPAVCLTQDVPYQQAADILLLGCGDARNILFTTYSDTSLNRKLDITCCDIEGAVLARNILLFSLLADDVDNSNNCSIWQIYYHFYLDDNALELLRTQSAKLQNLAISTDVWHGSEYGKLLRFCDKETLLLVRKYWISYSISDLPKKEKDQYNKRFRASIQKALDFKAKIQGNGVVITGLRSAAPTGALAVADLSQLHQYFWDHGGLCEMAKTKNSNPMFGSSLTDNFTLHYGLDPLLGYHLSTAYIPLAINSPLSGTAEMISKMHKVSKAAYLQFSEWSDSFRRCASHSLVLRFVAADALALCNEFHQKTSFGNSSKFQYRSQYQLKSIDLDGEDYATGSAPVMFDVIDTSNLIDHVGTINVLLSASPLLKPDFVSTLYTEVLVGKGKTRDELLDILLCGHFPTMSILLGLTPVEYWVNNSAIWTSEEHLWNAVSEPLDTGLGNQMHSRLAWKLSIPVTDMKGAKPAIRFEENDLAHLLHAVYQNMFQHENFLKLFSEIAINSLQTIKNNSSIYYHRGSLAMLLKFIKARVKVDWEAMMCVFLSLVETDGSISLSSNYIQEFYTQLHALQVYSMPTFHPDFKYVHQGEFQATPGSWENLPAIVCVTLQIPRSRLHVFTKPSSPGIGTPSLHCILESRKSADPWQNLFADVQLAFGKLVSTGARSDDDFRVDVIEDTQGWEGKSPLIVSFCIPKSMIFYEPLTTNVALGVQSTPTSSAIFASSLGPEMKVYQTELMDENNVFITKVRPNQSGYQPTHSTSYTGKGSHRSVLPKCSIVTAKLNSQKTRVVAFTRRIDEFSADHKTMLKDNAEVKVSQSSPFTLAIQIGKSIRYNANFPTPVLHGRSSTRISRKFPYIEVTAPIASHGDGNGFSTFMYPTFVYESSDPVLWNLPCINLEKSPIIDITKHSELQWLNGHIALQFSVRERELRERQQAPNGEPHHDPRINFKDSIFSLFIHFTGLQEQKSHVFGLNHPTGGGVHILIFVSCLRLDMANHTVVLDAAILPLTDELVPQLKSSLVALASEGICQIKVDGQELGLWKQNLAAFVERGRQWHHLSSCEYKTTSFIPLSVLNGQPMLCSCGTDKFPRNFISGVSGWNIFSKYAVRAAISPSFSLPYIEKIVHIDSQKFPIKVTPASETKPTSSSETKPPLSNKTPSLITESACHKCHKSSANEDVKLLNCAGCKKVKYCSKACQASDWGVHKRFCKAD